MILILNGSPQGQQGNGHLWIQKIVVPFLKKKKVDYKVYNLVEQKNYQPLLKELLNSQGVIFVTGTYWDSWGSPLQKFLEEMTTIECHPQLVGKPVSCFVLMHSVGGKSVLSQLQGVLNTMGFLIPPLSGMVYSLLNQNSLKIKNTHAEDFWSAQDVPIILENLLTSTKLKNTWKTWPFDKKSPQRIWLKKI